MSGPRVVSCPTCGKPVVWQAESRWRPFCCERCRLIDLGEWADESRRIPAEDTSTDFESDQDTPP